MAISSFNTGITGSLNGQEISAISLGGISATMIDVSQLTSNLKVYLNGFADGGTITVTCFGTAGTPGTLSVTFTDTGDTVNLTSHGYSNGKQISFASITTTTGISINTNYFVVNAAANTFQVSATPGGAALALTTNGSGTLNFDPTVQMSFNTATPTAMTLTLGAAGSGAHTFSFNAYVQNVAIDTGVDQPITTTYTLRISGAITAATTP